MPESDSVGIERVFFSKKTHGGSSRTFPSARFKLLRGLVHGGFPPRPIKRGLHADLSWNERKACRPRVILGLSGSSWYLGRLGFSTRKFSGFRSLGCIELKDSYTITDQWTAVNHKNGQVVPEVLGRPRDKIILVVDFVRAGNAAIWQKNEVA